MCLEVIWTYCELWLIGFLVGDYLNCVCMFLVTVEYAYLPVRLHAMCCIHNLFY